MLWFQSRADKACNEGWLHLMWTTRHDNPLRSNLGLQCDARREFIPIKKWTAFAAAADWKTWKTTVVAAFEMDNQSSVGGESTLFVLAYS